MHPSKSPIGIYRQYHHVYAISSEEILPLREFGW